MGRVGITDYRHVKGWGKPALFFAIIMLLTGIVYFILSILSISGIGNEASLKAGIIFEHASLVLFALTLILVAGLFARLASVSLKTLAPWLFVFLAVFVTYAVVNLNSLVLPSVRWPMKVKAMTFALMMTALPGILVLLAFLSRKYLGPEAKLRSVAIPAAFVSLVCGLTCGLLWAISAFSKFDYSYGHHPGLEKASLIFHVITYLGISVVLFLLLIPLILGVRGSGLTITATFAGGAAIIVTATWMVFAILNTISDYSVSGFNTAIWVSDPLVFITWGFSLVCLILLLERRNQIKEVLVENKEQLAELWRLTERLIVVWDEAENIQTSLAEGKTPDVDSYRIASTVADDVLNEYMEKWEV